MDSRRLFLTLLLSCLAADGSTASPFPPGSLPTSSGYLPILPNSAAALFFAFYEAQHPTSPLSSTPLIIWLHGGAGCSSLIANFLEIGPYLLSGDTLTLHPNPYSWNRRFGLLFIDNPLGAGFGTTPSPDLIPRDLPTVARHLFAAVQSFLSSHPSFRSRPLFLTGSSNAGKFISAAGYHFLHRNPHLPISQRINLAGVAVGNGLIHPIVQVNTHAVVAYYMGLINDRQRAYAESLQSETVHLIVEGRWSEVEAAMFRALNYVQNATGSESSNDTVITVFLNQEEVKEALWVRKGVVWEPCSAVVEKAMRNTAGMSVKLEMKELVRKSRVLLYEGSEDFVVGVASAEAWIKKMDWEGLERFMAAERKVWMVDGKRAGYVQRWGGLSHVVVTGAGHSAAADQKRNAQAMIEDWVMKQGFFDDQSIAQGDNSHVSVILNEALGAAPGVERCYSAPPQGLWAPRTQTVTDAL